MFKIGELARMAGVSVRTLHHYDHQDLFKPAQMTESGHRLYAPGQLAELRHILSLKALGLSLEEVRGVLTGEPFRRVLERKRAELLEERRVLGTRLDRLEAALEEETRMMQYLVEIKEVPAYRVLAARGKAPDYRHVSAPMGELFGEIGRALEHHNLRCVPPCVVVWHGGGYASEEEIELEAAEGFTGELTDFQPCGAVQLTRLPAARMAATVHRGPYERFGEAYGALLAWMDREGYVPAGPVREVYLHADSDPEHHVSELQVPVRQA